MLTRNIFLELIEKIDRELRGSDIPFPQRPLNAFGKLADKIDPRGSFEMRVRGDEIDEDDFSNDALYAQVHRWYESRYGDRIKIHPGPGCYILVIKDEPWEVVYPLCSGQNHFTIDANLQRENRRVTIQNGQNIPSINILRHVTNMTREVALSLSDDERKKILNEYMFGLNAVQSLRGLKDVPYMDQAMNDYDISVSNIFCKYPDYNNSKWASLQFAEKTMKAKLKLLGIDFDRVHQLSKLSDKLKPLSINIPDETISKIQCPAGVRYGENAVTKREAILAVQSALALYAQVFEASAYEYS
ncbi:MAG: hypothetical protein PHI06_14250 [Desulfobulbaceae bacterium]|nr:hypothetical protein [Desulfobulbaceae bacterium]